MHSGTFALSYFSYVMWLLACVVLTCLYLTKRSGRSKFTEIAFFSCFIAFVLMAVISNTIAIANQYTVGKVTDCLWVIDQDKPSAYVLIATVIGADETMYYLEDMREKNDRNGRALYACKLPPNARLPQGVQTQQAVSVSDLTVHPQKTFFPESMGGGQ